MAQVKIYALASHLEMCKTPLSDVIHSCLVDALSLPEEKRFQRFFALEPEDFIFPAERSEKYTILEIQMFAGRSEAAKKGLIRLLFERFTQRLGYDVNDLEINIVETPRANWGIRGQPGDELALPYKVEV
jgi:phenylpyruvate tautomerase PptA (4-oxalocrotonate tautomerase family)